MVGSEELVGAAAYLLGLNVRGFFCSSARGRCHALVVNGGVPCPQRKR